LLFPNDRLVGNPAAPAVWFAYSPDCKGEHLQQHLREFCGTLQADAFSGFNTLYAIQEAPCLLFPGWPFNSKTSMTLPFHTRRSPGARELDRAETKPRHRPMTVAR
jgi:hypothetical protein